MLNKQAPFTNRVEGGSKHGVPGSPDLNLLKQPAHIRPTALVPGTVADQLIRHQLRNSPIAGWSNTFDTLYRLLLFVRVQKPLEFANVHTWCTPCL
jgi:hypothetical protein